MFSYEKVCDSSGERMLLTEANCMFLILTRIFYFLVVIFITKDEKFHIDLYY